jgi:hypothetical protein
MKSNKNKMTKKACNQSVKRIAEPAYKKLKTDNLPKQADSLKDGE